MKRLVSLAAVALPVWAHVVSMSSGDLTIEGARGHYELRMPLYEVAHVRQPERALLEHIVFEGARMESAACREDAARDAYICTAEYAWPAPPERVDVECTLAAITVPNHVHLLRAEMGGKHDQGAFDAAFTHATLRFRPPTAIETALAQTGEGFWRALGGPVQWLLLVALAVAARSRRELALLTGVFVAGQALSTLLMPHTGWQAPPRFVEAAAALSLAYLAIEILLLPNAGARWAVAAALGIIHGLYFDLFVRTSGYGPGFVLCGAALAQLSLAALLGVLFARFGRLLRAVRAVQVSASALLIFGVVWFWLRVRG